MKPGKTLRVYCVTRHDGRVTGTLLRTWSGLFDGPPLAAYGADREDVLAQLGRLLAARGDHELERYLWDETFTTRAVDVEVHPQALHKKLPIIGAGVIPLRLTYAASQMQTGAFRLFLPRFDWWCVVEDLSIAKDVIGTLLSTAFLGESPRDLYAFRQEGEEAIVEWTPAEERVPERSDDEEDEDLGRFPTLLAVADELTGKKSGKRLRGLLRIEGSAPEPASLVPAAGQAPASLLLVGGPGVGKTSWMLRLALALAARKREQQRAERAPPPRLWRTSGDRILAGMTWLGMWQERCLQLVRELSDEGDWLYVDALTSICKPQQGGGSIAELLAPPMQAGQVALIAECTEDELQRLRRQMPTFVDAFRLVRVEETPASQLPGLLRDWQAQRGHARVVEPQALAELVQLLDRFERASLFPGKALRFLERLQQEAGPRPQPARLGARAVREAFSRQTGLPLALLDDARDTGRAQIAEALRAGVVGQDEACLSCAGALARLKAGLNDPERPVGVFLFAGPTGSGKTELAKQLARYLFGQGVRSQESGLEAEDERLVRLDMSEYLTASAAQRLLEVGPGVTSLAERVRRQPLSVVLLDEIEKAHPAVFDLLLGVLGEGRLADSAGRLVDFRMTVIVMTSNLGSGDAAAAGFGASGQAPDPRRAIREAFRPELLGRIDRVVAFRPLSLDSLERIVGLELRKLGARMGLVRRGVRLAVEPAARRRLAELGFDPNLGARPLKRVLEERVIGPLAVRLAREPGLRDVVVEVLAQDGEAWRAADEARRAAALAV